MADDLRAATRTHLAALVEKGKVPGVQYAVADAAGVWCESAGLSDLERNTPMHTATTLMAYSMSKTITAVAVLQLVEAGALGLDESAQNHVPNLPYPAEVTIRQLLSHTAGIPNPIPLRWVHAEARHAGFDEAQAREAIVRRYSTLAFRPGTKYAYSNIGYWLLGAVVERVSAMDFRSYVATHVLEPLGLGRDTLGYEVVDAGRHAVGYLERYSLVGILAPLLVDRALLGPSQGRWRRIHGHYLNGPAFGGLVGTAEAFGRFLRDQLAPESVLLGKTGAMLLREQQRTVDGAAVPMTLGWHVGTVRGQQVLFKEGGGGGFHCLMRLYPASGRGSVLMTNATRFDVTACLDVLDSAFTAPPPRG